MGWGGVSSEFYFSWWVWAQRRKGISNNLQPKLLRLVFKPPFKYQLFCQLANALYAHFQPCERQKKLKIWEWKRMGKNGIMVWNVFQGCEIFQNANVFGRIQRRLVNVGRYIDLKIAQDEPLRLYRARQERENMVVNILLFQVIIQTKTTSKISQYPNTQITSQISSPSNITINPYNPAMPYLSEQKQQLISTI